MTNKEKPQPGDPFGFTEQEKLWDQIGDRRMRAILEEAGTTIHKIEVDSNSYGEFAFVTVSREVDGQRSMVTLWGLGYHEYRERWIADHWRWYQGNPFPTILAQQMTLEEAQEVLERRRQEIAPYLAEETQSQRGRLYELLADMTDEDGALAELEDLGEAADWLLAGDPPVDTGEAENQEDDLPRTRPMFDDE